MPLLEAIATMDTRRASAGGSPAFLPAGMTVQLIDHHDQANAPGPLRLIDVVGPCVLARSGLQGTGDWWRSDSGRKVSPDGTSSVKP
jgi:hypothetical protein